VIRFLVAQSELGTTAPKITSFLTYLFTDLLTYLYLPSNTITRWTDSCEWHLSTPYQANKCLRGRLTVSLLHGATLSTSSIQYYQSSWPRHCVPSRQHNEQKAHDGRLHLAKYISSSSSVNWHRDVFLRAVYSMHGSYKYLYIRAYAYTRASRYGTCRDWYRYIGPLIAFRLNRLSPI